jgi:hypothetical protein
MFFVFLALFSVYLLCRFDFDEFRFKKYQSNRPLITYLDLFAYYYTYLDFILSGWVFCLTVEEIKEAFFSKENTLKLRILTYLRNNWNWLDLSGCLLYFLGFGIRLYSLICQEKYWFEIASFQI